MKANPISTNPNFSGKIVIKNRINPTQKYLFDLHKQALEGMIKDLPFDLFVEQSKSKKTILLSTNVKGANSYFVRKNEQDFVKTAGFLIEDSKKKSEIYQKTVRANEMLQNSYNAFTNIVLGNFKKARDFDKKLAALAVKDFENYKSIPRINYVNVPLYVQSMVMKNTLKYRLYKLFSAETPEEKLFSKMRKEYRAELKRDNKEIKTINVDFCTGRKIGQNA